ncbi:2-amino-4-hydroxy-6-hydroxymethyldihydropteridine diphosphokinase [Thermodesulfobacteriota bacterium]
MKKVFVGIGSNLGDSRKNCIGAIDRINDHPDCKVLKVSSFYSTEPVGVEDQNWFTNAVVIISTSLEAEGLMKVLLDIEREMGRIRTGTRWEARTIDLDILLFGDDIINKKNLTVPHPLMHKRRFVMAPITDIEPEKIHPVLGKRMAQILVELPEAEQPVKLLEN